MSKSCVISSIHCEIVCFLRCRAIESDIINLSRKERVMRIQCLLLALIGTLLFNPSILRAFIDTDDSGEAPLWDTVDSRGDISVIIELKDSNFEHLTQAATGATTGDWLVLLYVPSILEI